jgi:hypothetical protein
MAHEAQRTPAGGCRQTEGDHDVSNTDTTTQANPAAGSASPPPIPGAAPAPAPAAAQTAAPADPAAAAQGTQTAPQPKAPDVIKVDAAAAAAEAGKVESDVKTDAATVETKIKGLATLLVNEIEAIPGDISVELSNAKGYAVRALAWVETHFTNVKADATADAAKVTTDANKVLADAKAL